MVPEEERPQIEKIEEEIAALKSRIKNTEYDLANMFKGNAFLTQKLENTKKQLEEKKSILDELKKQDPKKAQKFEEFEDKVIEKESTAFSSEQEEIIEKEIEKQFN